MSGLKASQRQIWLLSLLSATVLSLPVSSFAPDAEIPVDGPPVARRAPRPPSASGHQAVPNNAVVKIHVTIQSEDYAMPWQTSPPVSGTGTGFVIGNKKILTNAHVVSNAKFLEVQKDGEARRYKAKVSFIGHDCDLAILEVEDASFFSGTVPVSFAKELPRLNDEVTVVGYPLGGDRISVTRGIVSRLDYSVYTHSSVDSHLVLQVDAAINPGNSGGPILYQGEVVGLAFQGLSSAENIGYGIPVPVIRHFLNDIGDGTYNGYPELGAFFLDTRNPALRRSLSLHDDDTGVVIYSIDPFGAAKGFLEIGDVILSTDGFPVASDGTIQLDGHSVLFSELLERKQWGESVVFSIMRKGRKMDLKVPLKNPPDPFVYRRLYDQRPSYLIVGGLVFSPLTREYLVSVDRSASSPQVLNLLYYSAFAKTDGLYEGKQEFVVLARRLPHRVNTYMEPFVNGLVSEVNGVKISQLSDVKKAIAGNTNRFHVVKFEGHPDRLVLDARAVRAADRDILLKYDISSPEYLPGDK